MKQNKKLDKVEGSLNPKQAVMLWLDEIRPHKNVHDYTRFINSQPRSEAPITRLTYQIDKAVRESMKGQHKDTLQRAARWAVRDVVFLVKLHQQANIGVMSEKRVWHLFYAFLTEKLSGMISDSAYHSAMARHLTWMNQEMPYPIDAKTASAIQIAIKHHVTTWEYIKESGAINDWLYDHFVAQEGIELPEGCCKLYDSKWHPTINEDNEERTRYCFQDEANFEKFRSGEDFSHGLASITDAEYSKHYDQMVSELHGLADSGQVQAGTSVYLDTVPILALNGAPLLEGKWLHRYVAELALWGAMIRDKGYQMQEKDDDHPLALSAIIREDEKEPDNVEIQTLRQQAAEMLSKFPGGTNELEGGTFVDFQDFLNWMKMKVKVSLTPETEKGLVTASWNTWVDAHGGEGVATVASVPVHYVDGYMDDSYYHLCTDTDEQLRKREQLLEYPPICQWKPEQKEKDFQLWKDLAQNFLIEICSFNDVVAFVSKRYFDGRQILFQDYADTFKTLLEETMQLVEVFNDLCEEHGERSYLIDLEGTRNDARNIAKGQVVKIVDMAKAKALESIGEDEESLSILKRYL